MSARRIRLALDALALAFSLAALVASWRKERQTTRVRPMSKLEFDAMLKKWNEPIRR